MKKLVELTPEQIRFIRDNTDERMLFEENLKGAEKATHTRTCKAIIDAMDSAESPSVRLNVYLTQVGYQADIFIDGHEQYSQCRDWVGKRPVSIEKARWLDELACIIERLRKSEND